ncbi:MAG: 50S ribosomal protein L11 methyltransferase [Clostridiales bacterium]|nr:50S ribosomal protein L11 methyltransferase [Clostridiales bacterium]
MKYTELTVHTTTEGSELVADVMWNYTTHGVTVCDMNDIIALQRDSTVYWDYMDEELTAPKKTDVLVKCFLSMESADETAKLIMHDIGERKDLSAGAIDFGTLEAVKRVIEGDDWIDVWKKHFRPLHIGARVVVVPEWIAYEKKEGEITVTLDSNMAFGTGEHETTSMCLELLQNYVNEGSVCIDVGCGSGILGIAAAKLGAKTCYLTDIDTIAVESAKHNCQKNGVSENVIVAHSNLLDNADIKGDVVFANITAEVLSLLAPSIPKNLKRDGVLILSGIIESRLSLVKEAYGAVGLHAIKEQKKGEWYALVLTF